MVKKWVKWAWTCLAAHSVSSNLHGRAVEAPREQAETGYSYETWCLLATMREIEVLHDMSAMLDFYKIGSLTIGDVLYTTGWRQRVSALVLQGQRKRRRCKVRHGVRG